MRPTAIRDVPRGDLRYDLGWDFRSEQIADRFVRVIDNDGQIRVLLMIEGSEVIAGEVVIAHLSEAGMVDMAVAVIGEMFALVGEDEA